MAADVVPVVGAAKGEQLDDEHEVAVQQGPLDGTGVGHQSLLLHGSGRSHTLALLSCFMLAEFAKCCVVEGVVLVDIKVKGCGMGVVLVNIKVKGCGMGVVLVNVKVKGCGVGGV